MTTENKPLKAYRVTHREELKAKTVLAGTPEEAAKLAGYLIDDCHVEETEKYDRYLKGHGSQIMIKLSIRICPFQDAVCQLQDDLECPNRPDAPDITSWVKQATKAHLCEHVGDEITRKEWLGRYKWAKIDEIPPASTHH